MGEPRYEIREVRIIIGENRLHVAAGARLLGVGLGLASGVYPPEHAPHAWILQDVTAPLGRILLLEAFGGSAEAVSVRSQVANFGAYAGSIPMPVDGLVWHVFNRGMYPNPHPPVSTPPTPARADGLFRCGWAECPGAHERKEDICRAEPTAPPPAATSWPIGERRLLEDDASVRTRFLHWVDRFVCAVWALRDANAVHKKGFRLRDSEDDTASMLLHCASELNEVNEATGAHAEQEFGDALAILVHVALARGIDLGDACRRWIGKIPQDFPAQGPLKDVLGRPVIPEVPRAS